MLLQYSSNVIFAREESGESRLPVYLPKQATLSQYLYSRLEWFYAVVIIIIIIIVWIIITISTPNHQSAIPICGMYGLAAIINIHTPTLTIEYLHHNSNNSNNKNHHHLYRPIGWW